MFDGYLLVAETGGRTAVFGPWFGRRGDNGVFTAEVVDDDFQSQQGSLNVSVFHKNSEDTGDGTLAGTAMKLSQAERKATTVDGLKELVRYKFELANDDAGSSAQVHAIFRMLAPSWFDSATVS